MFILSGKPSSMRSMASSNVIQTFEILKRISSMQAWMNIQMCWGYIFSIGVILGCHLSGVMWVCYDGDIAILVKRLRLFTFKSGVLPVFP